MESDSIMKDLQKDMELFKGFILAFENEKWNWAKKNEIWALPHTVRRYYVAYYNGEPYLLVGVNQRINIASISKITRNIFGKGSECLKKIIEIKLVPQCTAGVINVRYNLAGNSRVYRLFDTLRNPLPEGVEQIYVYNSCASIVLTKKGCFFESNTSEDIVCHQV